VESIAEFIGRQTGLLFPEPVLSLHANLLDPRGGNSGVHRQRSGKDANWSISECEARKSRGGAISLFYRSYNQGNDYQQRHAYVPTFKVQGAPFPSR